MRKFKTKWLPVPKPFTTWDEYRTARDQFYASDEWKALRRKIIARKDPHCVYCGRLPTPQNPLNVDHRKPLCRAWRSRLDPNNLQITCHECNLKKSGLTHKQMLWNCGKKHRTKRPRKRKRRQALFISHP